MMLLWLSRVIILYPCSLPDLKQGSKKEILSEKEWMAETKRKDQRKLELFV